MYWLSVILVNSAVRFGMNTNFSKGLVINYGEGGATKWENRGSVTFCVPRQDRDTTFCAPPF